MSSADRIIRLAAALAFLAAAACSNEGPTGPSTAPLFAKSGTAPSGGSGGGGGSTSTDSSATSPSPSGPPVAPTYTARIDSIGVVPTAYYYGTPSEWTIGGYRFEANYLTHLKPTAGPLVVGACVTVDFYVTVTGAYMASEIKTVDQSKCS